MFQLPSFIITILQTLSSSVLITTFTLKACNIYKNQNKFNQTLASTRCSLNWLCMDMMSNFQGKYYPYFLMFCEACSLLSSFFSKHSFQGCECSYTRVFKINIRQQNNLTASLQNIKFPKILLIVKIFRCVTSLSIFFL